MQLPKQGLNLHRGNPINLDILDKLNKSQSIDISQTDKQISLYSGLGRIARLKYSPTRAVGHIPVVKVRYTSLSLDNNPDAPYFQRNMLRYGIIPRSIILEITAHYKTSAEISTPNGNTTLNINDFESFILSIGPDGFYDHTSRKFNVVLFYYPVVDNDNNWVIDISSEIHGPEIGILVLPKIMIRDNLATMDPCLSVYGPNVIDYLFQQSRERGFRILDIKAITAKNVIGIREIPFTGLYSKECLSDALFYFTETDVVGHPDSVNNSDVLSLYMIEYTRKFFKSQRPFELYIYAAASGTGHIETMIFSKNPLFLNHFN